MGLGSNWEAVVNVVVTHTRDASLGNALHSRAFGCVGLAEAAVMIGESVTRPGWRRRVQRRFRSLERLHQVEILVPQRGRQGTIVRLEGLREACPIPVATTLAVQDLRERCVALEQRLAVVEREIGGPASAMRPKTGRK